jgi:hypothetical protein
MAMQLTEKIETITRKLRHYSGFDGQYINGVWRAGHTRSRLPDMDPFTAERLPHLLSLTKAMSTRPFRPLRRRSPRGRHGCRSSAPPSCSELPI